MNDTSKIVESATKIYAAITTNKPTVGDMVVYNESNPYVSKGLSGYDIATLVQLVAERNEVIGEMLESPSKYWTRERVQKLTEIYATEMAENKVLIAKLEAI